jgi:preprotein translocase subunit YajC
MFQIILAQDSESGGGGGSFVFTLLFMGLIFGAMYFLMIRPQRRRMREQAELQRSIGEGDEVVTTSGIYGFVTAIDGDVVWLEIAENTEIRIARAALTRVVSATDHAPDDDADDVEDAVEGADEVGEVGGDAGTK